MKRDLDLIRQILLQLEERDWAHSRDQLIIDGYTEETISYHIKLLHEAGFIEGIDVTTMSGLAWMTGPLTWEGHEFLDLSRNATLWNQAKLRIANSVGSVALDVLKQILVTLALKAINVA